MMVSERQWNDLDDNLVDLQSVLCEVQIKMINRAWHSYPTKILSNASIY